MFFDLKPIPSDDYEIVSIKEKRSEFNYHDAQKEFEFLLIPKHTGEIKVAFNFRIRRASDDAVAQAYRGSRDNVKSIPTIKVDIDTPTLTIEVKKLDKNFDAIGSFKFNLTLDHTKVNAYDRVNLLYTLKGKGYLNKSFEPIKGIKGVSIFRALKSKVPRATEDGYLYEKEWRYALVSKDSFEIPTVTLTSYDPQKSKEFNITTKAQTIEIKALNPSKFLDEEESPSSDTAYEKYTHYLYSILTFFAGFIFAKLLNLLPKKSQKKEQCSIELTDTKTAKEMLKNITPYINSIDLNTEIRELEDIVYNQNREIKFINIKKNILKKLKKAQNS
jgi:hypothetical protein